MKLAHQLRKAMLILSVIYSTGCTVDNPDFLGLAGVEEAGFTSIGGDVRGGGDSGGDVGGVEVGGVEVGGVEVGGVEMGGSEVMCLMEGDCDQDGSASDVDCDDYNSAVYPGAPEICDGIDNSCNDEIDEVVISCYSGAPDTLGNGTCRAGVRMCEQGVLSNCLNEVLPLLEYCGGPEEDRLDEDCDGKIDEGCDRDQDGVTVDQGDCDDHNAEISPTETELCNGLDDDCDQNTDEVFIECYDGIDATLGTGTCRGGEQRCIDGQLSACLGQVLPRDEICATNEDENCNGDIDENCSAQACATLNRNTPVQINTTCLTAGTYARLLVQVTPQLLNGAPLPSGVGVNLITQPELSVVASGREGNGWYWELVAPATPTVVTLSVQVDCGEGEQTTLIDRPVIEVVDRLDLNDLDPPFVIGGCTEPSGTVYVEVRDAESGEAISGASVMAGDQPTLTFQRDPAAALRGEAGSTVNYGVTNSRGRAGFIDLGENLLRPVTITAGADGYENMSIYQVEGGHVALWLRPLKHAQSGADADAQYRVRGQVTDFNSLSSDGDTDLALVLPSLSLGELTSKPINQLLSRFECWRPVSISPETLIPGNLFVPSQRELILFIERHLFNIRDHNKSTDHLIALGGKINTNVALGILMGGATASGLLAEVSFKEIGVRLDTALSAEGAQPVAEQTVPLSLDLNQTLASCTVSNVPAGTYASCLSAGEWTEAAQGTGRVFPMGISNINAELLTNGQSATRTLSFAPLNGEFSTINYLSAALALPTSDLPELRDASSAVIDRRTLTQAGGQLNFNNFLGLVEGMSYQQGQVQWSSVSRVTAPSVDACMVEVFVSNQLSYNPGSCNGRLSRLKESPLWVTYSPAEPQNITLPTLPESWPRANANGLLTDAQLNSSERLRLRVSCHHFLESFEQSFTNINWANLESSHVTVNQIDLP